jgi:hypothetical protein
MFWIKVIVSALVIAGVSELAKRYTLMAAILASLPLVSILAMVWLYIDTHDSEKVIALSKGIMWAIIPSVIFFIALPLILKTGLNFYLSLTASALLMFGAYSAYVFLMRKFGVDL